MKTPRGTTAHQFLYNPRRGFAALAVAAGRLIAFLGGAALAQSAAAQDVGNIPVKPAVVEYAIGEEVLDQDGMVASPFFTENRICSMRGCRVFIFDNRSGALIFSDGIWSDAFEETGRGAQAIRVKNFTFNEFPKPPPSDKVLETAPRIKSVKRF